MGYKVLSALLAIALVFVIAVSAEIRPYDGEHGVHERHYPRDFWNRAVSDNYVLFPVRDSNVPHADLVHTPIDKVINGQSIHGHLFRLSNPKQHFAFLPPLGGCPGRVLTSVTAAHFKCTGAMNGGFFDVRTGDCLGNLVSAGNVIEVSEKVNANFGLRSDGQYLIGYIQSSEVKSMDFTNLIQGVGWLVRNGSQWVNESMAIEHFSMGFVTLRAPRTAIGHDAEGNLLQLETDGDEPTKRGLRLDEFADLFRDLGAVNAVNLDGGGSATVYLNGAVINQYSDPCPSGIGRCERSVTSITCIA